MPKTPVIPVKLTDIREKDEYIAEAEKIADEHKVAKRDEKKKAKHAKMITERTPSLRERILQISLFPNIYNKPYIG
jgi:hypothetical protein